MYNREEFIGICFILECSIWKYGYTSDPFCSSSKLERPLSKKTLLQPRFRKNTIILGLIITLVMQKLKVEGSKPKQRLFHWEDPVVNYVSSLRRGRIFTQILKVFDGGH